MRPNPLDFAYKQYHTENEAIARLFKFCQSPYKSSVTNDVDDEI